MIPIPSEVMPQNGNKSKKHNPMLSQEILKECFDYYPDTGVLIWKFRPLNHFKNWKDQNRFNGNFANKIAGTIFRSKKSLFYKKVSVFYKGERWHFLCHRLIWMFVHGIDPGKLSVDHKNTNGLDNRLENLRLASHSQNGYNKSTTRRTINHDLPRGVYPSKEGDKFIVHVTINKKQKHVGTFKTVEDAVAAYNFAQIEAAGDFAHRPQFAKN